MRTVWGLLLVFVIYVFPVGHAPAAEDLKIDIHGYISQGFLIANKNNYLADTEKGSFQFNELGINFSTELTDKLRIGIQLAARDLGDLGNDRVTIDWAFADYRFRDWLGLRVGLIKMPIGLYNKTRDIDMLRTSILLPQGIYSETFRDTATAMKGIGGYGDVPLKALGDFSYQVLFGTMNIDKESSTTKGVEAGGGGGIEVERYDVGNVFCGAITWDTPMQGLRFGVSHETVRMVSYSKLLRDIVVPVSFPPFTLTVAEKGMTVVSETPFFRKTVSSAEYTWKNLVLAAEYSRLVQKIISNIPGLGTIERKLDIESFYGSVSYRFSRWFEAGVYYSVFYKDRNDRDGTKMPYNPPFSAFQKDACLSLRFDLHDHWIFKLEGHLMDGTGSCFAVDNLNEDGVPEFDRKWFLLAAKMTFSF